MVQIIEKFETETIRRMFKDSEETKIPNKSYSFLFDNASMARVLDMFLLNPNIPIFTTHFLNKASISQKAFWRNVKILDEMGLIHEFWVGRKKFYQWNGDNPSAKHISRLGEVINNKNNNVTK